MKAYTSTYSKFTDSCPIINITLCPTIRFAVNTDKLDDIIYTCLHPLNNILSLAD